MAVLFVVTEYKLTQKMYFLIWIFLLCELYRVVAVGWMMLWLTVWRLTQPRPRHGLQTANLSPIVGVMYGGVFTSSPHDNHDWSTNTERRCGDWRVTDTQPRSHTQIWASRNWWSVSRFTHLCDDRVHEGSLTTQVQTVQAYKPVGRRHQLRHHRDLKYSNIKLILKSQVYNESWHTTNPTSCADNTPRRQSSLKCCFSDKWMNKFYIYRDVLAYRLLVLASFSAQYVSRGSPLGSFNSGFKLLMNPKYLINSDDPIH